jgi:RNA polymerase sigma-70 factor (ECF subfamily)
MTLWDIPPAQRRPLAAWAHRRMCCPAGGADRFGVAGLADFSAVLDGARSGDGDALGELWRCWNPAVLRYLRGRRVPEPEDVASSTWLDVARGLSRFVGDEDHFRRWLFTIAHRRASDAARRRPPVEVMDIGPAVVALAATTMTSPEDEVVGDAQLRDALRLVARLPVDQAEVVLLRVLGDLDVAAVAEIVGKSPSHVRVLAHRGLARLAVLVTSTGESAGTASRFVTPADAAAMKGTT